MELPNGRYIADDKDDSDVTYIIVAVFFLIPLGVLLWSVLS